MKREKPVLLVLGVPPPYGGGEIRDGIVAERLVDDQRFCIFRYRRGRSSKSTQGRATIANVLFGLYYIARCWVLILWKRPRRMYVGLPKNFLAFARVIPVILFASVLRVEVYGELTGGRFLFLETGWQRRIGLSALRRLSSIRFLGEHIRQAYHALGLRRPVAIANGILMPEDRTPAPPPSGERLELLYVGALNRTKGVGRIVEAVRLCRDRGLDVACTLLGEWSDISLRQEVEEFVQRDHLGDVVRFPGLVKGEGKWEYFRRASILVHPTEWDGQPLTILEAYGMGLAVISTPVGAIPDTVVDGENGLLLAENTASALTEAICELDADRDRLARIMAHNRQDFERRFTFDRYLANLQEWLLAP